MYNNFGELVFVIMWDMVNQVMHFKKKLVAVNMI